MAAKGLYTTELATVSVVRGMSDTRGGCGLIMASVGISNTKAAGRGHYIPKKKNHRSRQRTFKIVEGSEHYVEPHIFRKHG